MLLVFVVLSIVLITLDRRGNLGPIERARDLSQDLVAPIQRGLAVVARPVRDLFSSIGDLTRLREENRDLEDTIDALREEIDQARELAHDNIELREQLELDQPWFAQDRVAAQVIANAPGNFRWAVMIDKGGEDGIEIDMAVVNPRGLVGKIIEVDRDRSVVLLLVDPKGGAAAEVETSGVGGLVAGNGGGRELSLHFVDKHEELSIGGVVVTSNFNRGIFPPGIPIGTVSTIDGDARAAELDIGVRPFVDFEDLNILSVLLETGRRGPAERSG